MPASPPQNSTPSPGHDGPTVTCAAPAGPDDPEPGAEPRITLTIQTPDTNPPIGGWVDVMLAKIARHAGVHAGQINLLIVNDDHMSHFHEQYCNIPGTTDVLTFDTRDDPGVADPAGVEADIVICLDEAARHAAIRNHPVRAEVLLYAVHGLLHLLGEADHDPAAYQRMHQREDELLAAAGVGPVFGNPSP